MDSETVVVDKRRLTGYSIAAIESLVRSGALWSQETFDAFYRTNSSRFRNFSSLATDDFDCQMHNVHL
jgi:hypothetical protein